MAYKEVEAEYPKHGPQVKLRFRVLTSLLLYSWDFFWSLITFSSLQQGYHQDDRRCLQQSQSNAEWPLVNSIDMTHKTSQNAKSNIPCTH